MPDSAKTWRIQYRRESFGSTSQRLTKLVDDLLEMSRFDAGQASLQTDDVDVIVDGRERAELTVTVADDGPGVPSYLEPMIFDRFVRADAARTSHGEHTGLGLAIALENARLHGATLSLSTSGRTAFTLRLPRRS